MRTRRILLKVSEAADFLGVSPAYAFAMARRGCLPVVHLGKRTRRVSLLLLRRDEPWDRLATLEVETEREAGERAALNKERGKRQW